MRAMLSVWFVPAAALSGALLYACSSDTATPPAAADAGLDAGPLVVPDAAPPAEAGNVPDGGGPTVTVHVTDSVGNPQAGAEVLFASGSGTATQVTTGGDGVAAAPVQAGSSVTVARFVGTSQARIRRIVSVLGVSNGDVIEIGRGDELPVGPTALHAAGSVSEGPPADAGLALGGYTFQTNANLTNDSKIPATYDYSYPKTTLDDQGNATILAAAIDLSKTPLSWAVKTVSPGDGGTVTANFVASDWAAPAASGSAKVTGTAPGFANLYSLSVGFPRARTLFAAVSQGGSASAPTALAYVAPPAPLGSLVYANAAWFDSASGISSTVGHIHVGAVTNSLSLDVADVLPRISGAAVTGTDKPSVSWQSDAALPSSGAGSITLTGTFNDDAGVVDPLEWTLAFAAAGTTKQEFPSLAGLKGFNADASGWHVSEVVLVTSAEVGAGAFQKHPDVTLGSEAFPTVVGGAVAFDAKYTAILTRTAKLPGG